MFKTPKSLYRLWLGFYCPLNCSCMHVINTFLYKHFYTITFKVSIIFHFAASLRLEAPLKEGLEMNTKGTMRVLEMAKKMKSLVSFIHLSTAFCYPDYERMAEKVFFTILIILLSFSYLYFFWTGFNPSHISTTVIPVHQD